MSSTSRGIRAKARAQESAGQSRLFKYLRLETARLCFLEITCGDGDQTQSVFGRLSFGSEQFQQYFVEEKSPNPEFEKGGSPEGKKANPQKERKPGEFTESEAETRRKEESLQNSKLRDQIVLSFNFLHGNNFF